MSHPRSTVPAMETAAPTMTLAELADEITTWAGREASAKARLLALIGEFDEREGWAGSGTLSCAHWLSWRLGMGLAAAHEHVRVARKLRSYRVVAREMEAGRLSWTQTRAVTRIISPAREVELVEMARSCTGAQLEKVVRGVRRSEKGDPDLPPGAKEGSPESRAYREREALEARRERMRPRKRWDEDGTLVLTLRYSAEDAQVVLAALEATQADLDGAARESSAEEPETPAPSNVSLSEALQNLCEQVLDGRLGTHRAARRRLTALVDPASGWTRLHDGELLPPGSIPPPVELALRRLRRLDPLDLTRHDLGRSARHADDNLRAQIGMLDGECCSVPGCGRRRHLHAHHITLWADGGRTDLDNLRLLCPRHHALLHEGAFTIEMDDARRITVTTATGEVLLPLPDLPWRDASEIDPDGTVSAETLPPHWYGDRLDLGHVVWVVRQRRGGRHAA